MVGIVQRKKWAKKQDLEIFRCLAPSKNIKNVVPFVVFRESPVVKKSPPSILMSQNCPKKQIQQKLLEKTRGYSCHAGGKSKCHVNICHENASIIIRCHYFVVFSATFVVVQSYYNITYCQVKWKHNQLVHRTRLCQVYIFLNLLRAVFSSDGSTFESKNQTSIHVMTKSATKSTTVIGVFNLEPLKKKEC